MTRDLSCTNERDVPSGTKPPEISPLSSLPPSLVPFNGSETSLALRTCRLKCPPPLSLYRRGRNRRFPGFDGIDVSVRNDKSPCLGKRRVGPPNALCTREVTNGGGGEVSGVVV